MLLRDWAILTDNGFPPPEVTDQERRKLAIAYSNAKNKREKISGSRSFEGQESQVDELDRRMQRLWCFIGETLRGKDNFSDLDSTVENFITDVEKEEREKREFKDIPVL